MSDLVALASARRISLGATIHGWLPDGEIKVYTTPLLSTADEAISSQTHLLTIGIPDPAGSHSDGLITILEAAFTPGAVIATGLAAFVVFSDDTGARIGIGDCGLTGSESVLTFDNLSLTAGALVNPTAFTLLVL